MKVGLDKKKIIEAAADMADEKGIANVTLKVLATEFGIKPPSLYKHFSGGLDELNKELMLYGWRSLESEITRAAIGKANKGDEIQVNFYNKLDRRTSIHVQGLKYNVLTSEGAEVG